MNNYSFMFASNYFIALALKEWGHVQVVKFLINVVFLKMNQKPRELLVQNRATSCTYKLIMLLFYWLSWQPFVVEFRFETYIQPRLQTFVSCVN